MRTPTIRAALVASFLLSGCATQQTMTRTWGDPSSGGWARYGHVQTIRETVQVKQGDPAGGAAAGAAIGGLFGALLGGHSHHGYYHPSGAGAVFGAATGAMVGAAASQSSERRTYEVNVVFDDGGYQTFLYASWPGLRPGQAVQFTQYGLSPVGPPVAPPSGAPATPPSASPSDAPVTPPSAPPSDLPPPPPGAPPAPPIGPS